jgi:hypothetical protein
MQTEDLVRNVYRRFLEKQVSSPSKCLSEEELALFLQGDMDEKTSRGVEAHIALCSRCAEIAALYYRAGKLQEQVVPEQVVEKAKTLVGESLIFEAAVRLKGKFMELLRTTSDAMRVGDIAPVPVLRGRGIREFKEEISLVKEFEEIRIALKLDKKDKDRIRIGVVLSDKVSLSPITDLRVALFRENKELESYFARSGTAVFEGLSYGLYTLEISRRDNRIGIIKLEIR